MFFYRCFDRIFYRPVIKPRGTASADALFKGVTESFTWPDATPSVLKGLNPRVVGELATAANCAGYVLDAVVIGVDVVGAVKEGDTAEATDAIGSGVAKSVGGTLGAEVPASQVATFRPHPLCRLAAGATGFVLGTEAGQKIFDFASQPPACPSPIYALEEWLNGGQSGQRSGDCTYAPSAPFPSS